MHLPVVPDHQPPPVVHPGMGAFHDPAGSTSCIDLLPGTGLARPLALGDRGTNSALAQPATKGSTVIAFVRSQDFGTLLGPAPPLEHPNLVRQGQRHPLFMDVGSRDLQGQGESSSIRQEMGGAPLAFPTRPNGCAPFFAGTKLPSRKAFSQSNFLRASNVLSMAPQIRSQTPCSCHCWSRR